MSHLKHTWYRCPPQADGKPPHYDDEMSYCAFCDGGLGSCTMCKGAEGSLPRECPRQEISTADQDLIYKGTLDFRDGQWIRREYERWETPDAEKETTIDAAVIRLNEVRVCASSTSS